VLWMEQIHLLDFGDAPKLILDRLVHEKGLGRHGFFFTTDEGKRPRTDRVCRAAS
jgi:hypothetical protein